MGAGRKTETYYGTEKPTAFSTVNCSRTARNLGKNNLGGAIFGCKYSTIGECFSKKLFGLPSPHYSYVKNITPGLELFLFNYSDRRLHGIFEAASPGRLDIDPNAWTADGSYCTPYSAQVKFSIRMRCNPLREDQFAPVIAENYYEAKLFWFELDRDQTNKLVSLFSASPSVPWASIPIHAHYRNASLEASHNLNAEKADANTESEALISSERPRSSGNGRVVLPSKPWSGLFAPATTSAKTGVIPEANHGKELQYHSIETTTADIKSSNTLLKTESGFVAREVVGENDHRKDAKGCLKETLTTDLKSWSAQVKTEDGSYARGQTEGIITSPFPREPSGLFETEFSTLAGQMSAVTINALNLDVHSVVSVGSTLPHETSGARFRQTISDKTAEDNHRDDLTQHLTEGVSTMESSDLHSIVAKLSLEIQALRLSRFIQDGKIGYLEQKLVESSLEIQQLRDWCKKLDSSLSRRPHRSCASWMDPTSS